MIKRIILVSILCVFPLQASLFGPSRRVKRLKTTMQQAIDDREAANKKIATLQATVEKAQQDLVDLRSSLEQAGQHKAAMALSLKTSTSDLAASKAEYATLIDLMKERSVLFEAGVKKLESATSRLDEIEKEFQEMMDLEQILAQK